MTENLKKFEEALKGDKALAEKFEAEVRRIAAEKPAANNGEAVVQGAKTLGFEVTLADFEKMEAVLRELDPDELEAVAGGERIDKQWCLFDYSCFVAVNTNWKCG